MKSHGPKRKSPKNRRIGKDRRRVERRKGERRNPVLDELYFSSIEEVLKRWPDELWASKGKPRLWVRVYEEDEITVWRDVGYGGVKLKTPRGMNEGNDVVSVDDTIVLCHRGELEVRLKKVMEIPEVIYPLDTTEISPEEDTLDLQVKEKDAGKKSENANSNESPNLTLMRSVSLTKVEGEDLKKSKPVIGWEEAPPAPSKRYRIRLKKGKAFRTSIVEEVVEKKEGLLIKTGHSVYKVKYLK
jgi:hypothetical protein